MKFLYIISNYHASKNCNFSLRFQMSRVFLDHETILYKRDNAEIGNQSRSKKPLLRVRASLHASLRSSNWRGYFEPQGVICWGQAPTGAYEKCANFWIYVCIIVYRVIVLYNEARAVRALSFGLLQWLSGQRLNCWEIQRTHALLDSAFHHWFADWFAVPL